MPQNGFASKLPWVFAFMLAIITLVAIMWRPSPPLLIPLDTSTRADVVIVGNTEECAADPMSVVLRYGDALCFTNTLEETVTLKFDVPVLWGGQLVSEIDIPPRQTECVTRDPNSIVAVIAYDVWVGSTQCSDPSNRPKIIINPPGGTFPTPTP